MSEPIEPLPAGLPAQFTPMPNLRAVAFDIYGTLFISASGDISLASPEDRDIPLREAIVEAGAPADALAGQDLGERFTKHIQRAHQRARDGGIAFPEVEIRDTWKELLREIAPEWAAGLEREQLEYLAVAYECRANPVWPMPHLAGSLMALREMDIPLGIVSNAQFFTPLLFEAFLGKTPDALGLIDDLCIWSYRAGEAKPSRRLFAQLRSALADLEIGPEDCLYIGNDLRNDVWPAREEGFRTALFAGDRRSLRLRANDPDCIGVEPDAILTDLRQIPNILGRGH